MTPLNYLSHCGKYFCLNSIVIVQLFLSGLHDFYLFDRFPFDWRNLFGYLLVIFIQFALTFNLLHYVACAISIALGLFLFTISCVRCMEKDLKSINKMAKKFKKSKKDEKLQSDMLELLLMFICAHTEIQQLSA